MTEHITGAFDIKLASQPPDADGSQIGRMILDKQFHGELDASSKGQMLAFRSPVQGSAAYVAMEQVSGTIKGRKGSFVLQHSGTMTRGEQHLTLTVVPDSGTGELTGLAGKMGITITDGKHFYDFDYTLPGVR